MTTFFPAGAFIWLIIYLCKEYNKEEPKAVIENKQDRPQPKRNIQYISNGRVLTSPHWLHYFNILSLNESKRINDHTIKNAARKRQSLINKIEDEGENPVASRDIVAAKYYLLDNWAYMTHLN